MVRAKVACLRVGQLAPATRARRSSPNTAATSISPRALRAAAASGARHHARPVRLRQDHADAGAARSDRRDPDPHRRRAQAAARPRRARRAAAPALGRAASTLPTRPSATYRRALALADAVATPGCVAIVDGTFLKRWQRDLFRARAAELGRPVRDRGVHARATRRCARASRERAQRATDASEADLARARRTSCARASRSRPTSGRTRWTSMPRRRRNARATPPPGARSAPGWASRGRRRRDAFRGRISAVLAPEPCHAPVACPVRFPGACLAARPGRCGRRCAARRRRCRPDAACHRAGQLRPRQLQARRLLDAAQPVARRAGRGSTHRRRT